MQLDWDEHFEKIVLAAIDAYKNAERELISALIDNNCSQIKQKKFAALREAGAAAFYLHHYAEVVLRAKPEWLPNAKDVKALQMRLSEHCSPQTDVGLLCDLVNALKHAILTKNLDKIQVDADGIVLTVDRADKASPVRVVTTQGCKSLTLILNNVVKAWKKLQQGHPESNQCF